MSAFEKQLQRIADKAELHTFVDSLPDDAIGILIVRLPPEPHECGETHEGYRYREIGDITIEQSLYAVKSWEHWIFHGIVE